MGKYKALSLFFSIALNFSCTQVKTGFFKALGQVDEASKQNDPVIFKKSLETFDRFLQEHKLWEKDSFLGDQGVSRAVSYINCLETLHSHISDHHAEQSKMNKLEMQASEAKNPLIKLSGVNPKGILDAIADKMEETQQRLTIIKEQVFQTRTQCSADYASLLALK